MDYLLKTERIGFSHWTDNDLPLARQLWGNAQVTRFISTSGGFTDKQVIERLHTEIRNQAQYGVSYWPLFLLETDEFIGCCGLRPYPAEQGVYELGSHLLPPYWRKGLGSEATRAVIDYAFDVLGVADLFTGHHPENTASAALVKRLGFHYIEDVLYEPTGLMHPSYRYKR
ncbi:GNAT family N-acetyltransferase, partial [Eubacteriales bacterium OttesenSCG-928-N13]|nr:GNAT family N-acetyltransferase [Eubacteriales bacterium OttesenSCG-928-N13]